MTANIIAKSHLNIDLNNLEVYLSFVCGGLGTLSPYQEYFCIYNISTWADAIHRKWPMARFVPHQVLLRSIIDRVGIYIFLTNQISSALSPLNCAMLCQVITCCRLLSQFHVWKYRRTPTKGLNNRKGTYYERKNRLGYIYRLWWWVTT